MNWAGVSIIIVGIMCIWTNWIITRGAETEYQNLIAIKDNFLKMDDNKDIQQDSNTLFSDANIASDNKQG